MNLATTSQEPVRQGLNRFRHAGWPAWCEICCLFAVTAFCSWPSLAVAQPVGPSSDDPLVVLPGRDGAECAALHKEAATKYAAGYKAILALEEKAKDDKITVGAMQEAGKTFVVLKQSSRLAGRLAMQGEPAGVELELRIRAHQGILKEIQQRILKLPEMGNRLPKVYKALALESTKRQKVIPRAEKLGQQRKWQEAADMLYEATDALDVFGFWFDGTAVVDIYNPFLQPLTVATNELHKMLREAAAAELKNRRDEEAPNLAALVETLNKGAQELRATGQAAVNGDSLPGPRALGVLATAWQEAHRRAYRTRALDWISIHASNKFGYTIPVATQYAEFHSAMLAGLGTWVQADAERATADTAPAMHQAYLAPLCELAELIGESEVTQACGLALDLMAQKSPAYGAMTTAYDRAIKDMLRWRERAAAAHARYQQTEYPPLDQVVGPAITRQAGMAGLLDEQVGIPRWLDPAPAVAKLASDRLAAGKASVFNLVRLSPDTQAGGISRLKERTYAVTPAIAIPQGEMSALARELLLSDGVPPLTLAGWIALDLGGDGQFAQVGGTLNGITLEAVATRFANLTAADLPFLGLGPLTQETAANFINQVQVRCDLTPRWVRHRYFYFELAAQ